MAKGMSPNTMSWHHVTILHDMAQKGNIEKAELLKKMEELTLYIIELKKELAKKEDKK